MAKDTLSSVGWQDAAPLKMQRGEIPRPSCQRFRSISSGSVAGGAAGRVRSPSPVSISGASAPAPLRIPRQYEPDSWRPHLIDPYGEGDGAATGTGADDQRR